jgi:hypothetical protein
VSVQVENAEGLVCRLTVQWRSPEAQKGFTQGKLAAQSRRENDTCVFCFKMITYPALLKKNLKQCNLSRLWAECIAQLALGVGFGDPIPHLGRTCSSVAFVLSPQTKLKPGLFMRETCPSPCCISSVALHFTETALSDLSTYETLAGAHSLDLSPKRGKAHQSPLETPVKTGCFPALGALNPCLLTSHTHGGQFILAMAVLVTEEHQGRGRCVLPSPTNSRRAIV